MAALTRSGARKASEIVMLILRALQPSRCAIASAVFVRSITSSFNHCRPLAIEAIRSARFSDRIGRTGSDDADAGKRISRRHIDEVLRHGTASRRKLGRRFAFAPFILASSMNGPSLELEPWLPFGSRLVWICDRAARRKSE